MFKSFLVYSQCSRRHFIRYFSFVIVSNQIATSVRLDQMETHNVRFRTVSNDSQYEICDLSLRVCRHGLCTPARMIWQQAHGWFNDEVEYANGFGWPNLTCRLIYKTIYAVCDKLFLFFIIN